MRFHRTRGFHTFAAHYERPHSNEVQWTNENSSHRKARSFLALSGLLFPIAPAKTPRVGCSLFYRSSVFFVSFALLSFLSSPAFAQQQEWVLSTPSGRDDVESVREALRETGLSIADEESLKEQFESQVSSPAASLSESEIDEWANRSVSAVRNIARTDYEAAREDLLAAQRVSERAAEELNRESERAREVLDTCLYMVRAYEEQGQREEAYRQARECRRLVPLIEPSEYRHTPEVVDILERVDADQAYGILEVTSTPAGCAVRVNGVAQAGVTPLTLERIPQGDYRLQVECDESERGRVHRITVSDGRTVASVDQSFDRAFESVPRVHATQEDTLASALRLAAETERTITLVQRDGEALLLTRIRPSGERNMVRYGAGADRRAPIASLLGGESLDYTQDPPVPMGGSGDTEAESLVETAAPVVSGPGLPGWRIGLGIGTLALGIGGGVAATMLHFRRDERGDRYLLAEPTDPDFLTRQSDWRSLRTPIVAISLVSGGLLGASAFLLTPPRGKLTFLTVVSGLVGLGLVSGAVVLGFTGEECESVADTRQECVSHGSRTDVAWMLGSLSIPFLIAPIAGLMSPPADDAGARLSITNISFGVDPVQRAASLRLSGTF